jgi:hypothetical protein
MDTASSKTQNVLTMPHAGSAKAVLSDFNPLLDAASPSKRTSAGTTWCSDPRVRGGGEYGTEVDMYSRKSAFAQVVKT